jgi:hypothetical protein
MTSGSSASSAMTMTTPSACSSTIGGVVPAGLISATQKNQPRSLIDDEITNTCDDGRWRAHSNARRIRGSRTDGRAGRGAQRRADTQSDTGEGPRCSSKRRLRGIEHCCFLLRPALGVLRPGVREVSGRRWSVASLPIEVSEVGIDSKVTALVRVVIDPRISGC